MNRSFSRAAISPTTPGCQLAAAVTTTAPFSSSPSAASRLGFGLRQHDLLDRLALAVEPVELGGDAAGLDRIVGQQQLRAEIGAADAAAGVDARAEQEAEMPRLRRADEPRGVHQRGQADVARAGACAIRPLATKARLSPLSGDHVGDGAERDEIEKAEQIGLRPRRVPEAARAQHRG